MTWNIRPPCAFTPQMVKWSLALSRRDPAAKILSFQHPGSNLVRFGPPGGLMTHSSNLAGDNPGGTAQQSGSSVFGNRGGRVGGSTSNVAFPQTSKDSNSYATSRPPMPP